MTVLLLGGTDLTLAVGERLLALGIEVGGVVHVGARFDISYSSEGVANARAADVDAWCAERGIPSHPYAGVSRLGDLVAGGAYELGVAAGWYHMVPRGVRERLPAGCLGVHASLLPRLRGGAPLNWALLSGETESGVTLFELGDGVDDGPVYGQRAFPIGPRATIAELVELAEAATLALIDEFVPRVLAGGLEPTPQTGEPTYGLQRRPEDATIDWSRPATEIDRLVRAVGRPYPGARTSLDGDPVHVWATEPFTRPQVLGSSGQLAAIPGEDAPVAVTGDGALRLLDATDPAGRSLLDELRAAANRRFDAPR